MNETNKEKHISVPEDLHKRLQLLAKQNSRTMRGMLDYMMAKEESLEKLIKKEI